MSSFPRPSETEVKHEDITDFCTMLERMQPTDAVDPYFPLCYLHYGQTVQPGKLFQSSLKFFLL